MSRLDSVIRRLQAQRACLAHAVALVEGLPGPMLELGLGQGRTYDHLRILSPQRTIIVFEREVAAMAESVPGEDCLILGDIRHTLPRMVPRFARKVPLVHSDIGTGDTGLNAKLAACVATHLAAILCPGGIVVSDQDLNFPGAVALPLPNEVPPGRYFMYRAG